LRIFDVPRASKNAEPSLPASPADAAKLRSFRILLRKTGDYPTVQISPPHVDAISHQSKLFMNYAVAYDITRLMSRVLDATPNGIDRVDMMLADYFLKQREATSNGMLSLGALGYRVIDRAGAEEAVDVIFDHYGEAEESDSDVHYRNIRSWLVDGAESRVKAPYRVSNARKNLIGVTAGWLQRHGVSLAKAPKRHLPLGARYINVSQYPLAVSSAFDWAALRPDVKLVFFIHDMLPLEMPEYFRKSEFAKHEQRLSNVARHAAGAVVSTHIVKDAFQKHLAKHGRTDLPILVAPLPISPIFLQDDVPDGLSARPFFIQCGTIEPRKNHLMILQVWRELVARHGKAAPKLVLVGARGWENENVVDLLERCPSLSDYVLEVSGLPTPSLRRLLKAARALLMPSFGEGYGLPLVEALSLGTPAVASDIPVFREIAGDACVKLSPIDGEGWLRVIEALAGQEPDQLAKKSASCVMQTTPKNFCHAVDEFLGSV
jgi:glycosyltransferase involved in cell wall biosynthesis